MEQSTFEDFFWLTLVYPHTMLISFMEPTVRCMSTFETAAAGLKVVAPS